MDPGAPLPYATRYTPPLPTSPGLSPSPASQSRPLPLVCAAALPSLREALSQSPPAVFRSLPHSTSGPPAAPARNPPPSNQFHTFRLPGHTFKKIQE